MSKSAGIVLKTVERCNINCTYCYYFNKQDQSYKQRKPYISKQIIEQTISFINQGIIDFEIDDLTIQFHGGEPLLQKKSDFAEMCDLFKNKISPSIKTLIFSLQTNGMLLDKEWIELFRTYDVGIGISLDGDKKTHDTYRIDKKGRGTYNQVVEKIKLCNTIDYPVGILSVINPKSDGRMVYRHLVDEVRATYIDFLIPDHHHNDLPPFTPEECGRFLVEAFNEWTQDNHEEVKISIRCFENMISIFMGETSKLEGVGKLHENSLPLICISNDGTLGPLDELRICTPHEFMKYNIFKHSWKEFLADDFFKEYATQLATSPDECKNCLWEKICAGGTLLHRYSDNNRFSNKSIYCDGLKKYYEQIFTYLINNGYCENKLKSVLL